MRLIRSSLLLLCLLLLAASPLRAQGGQVYRDASPDSLRQVLARQRSDTAAVRIEHLPVQLLSKRWRYHPGDNPAWARPDFDDSRWGTFDPARPRHEQPRAVQEGICWLRLRFRLSDSLRQRELVLRLLGRGALEVYLNGRLVQRQGVMAADPAKVVSGGIYPPPCPVPAVGPAVQVLAVRSAPWKPLLLPRSDQLPHLVVGLFTPQQFWERREQQKAAPLVLLLLVGFSAPLAFLHFAFFYYNPTRRANRYFARFALTVALAALLGYCCKTIAFPTLVPNVVLLALSNILAALQGLWAIRALSALFHFRPGLLYKGLWLAFGAVAVLQCVSLNSFTSAVWTTLVVVNVAEQLRLTVRALRQRQRGARLIAAGFAGGMLAALVYGAVVQFRHMLPPIVQFVPQDLPLVLGFVLPALGISLFLAREFALDAELLQIKLGEVENLSARTLVQEQEKQALLAQQNETLETQVQRRTNELEQSLTELRATQVRLGQLDAAKNQFFANVSHELRTPLTLVLGPLDGLLTPPAPALPAAVREPVALAHRSARRLQEMVNRILDLTKLQAGRLELHPVPTAVAPLLRRVVTQFESLAAERQVALVAPRLLPEGLRLLLDADKVEQILTNLLINALNHTPAGGAVTVGAALPDAAGHYVLTVRDTGPGIAPTEQERVFERFYQSPQRQAQGGTGLGLALSRELATLLGGTLTLESAPGQGAAFTLRFQATALRVESEELRVEGADDVDLGDEEGEMEPASDNTPVFPTLNSSLLTLNSKPRVLVVEDQPDLREYLRQLLAPAYEVLTAVDGQDALDVLAHEAPVDLVTTDAMMPRLSGTELLAHLKADPARAGLPVLMLTARADDAHRLASLTVGVDDYLTKPFVPAELLARVATLLRRHAVRRQFARQLPEALAPAEPLALETAPAATRPTALAAKPAEAALPLISAEGAEQLTQWQAQVESFLVNPDFGPAELASLLCLSERTLYRRLGELAGLTPAAWLRELRLDCARQLLEAGDFSSVADVAAAAGFVNARSFAARYAERFGRRPHTYRT